MSEKLNLILALPQGVTTATNLGLEGYAWHRSPGSGKYFQGRSIFIDLELEGHKPGFKHLDEGGWRDADGDTLAAINGVLEGKRTKTALSNNAFSCTPIDAYRSVHLVKTGGEILELDPVKEIAKFEESKCEEEMSPDQVADAAGLPRPHARAPRIYLVFAPLEFLLLSNLTPEEYVWYSTHRHGKVFRQVMFTELKNDQLQLAAENVYHAARRDLLDQAHKKTKTIIGGDCINRVPFNAWEGYHEEARGGLWVGDKSHVRHWRIPANIPRAWERAV